MTPIRRYTSCQDFVEEVTAYDEGALAGAGRDRFEEHHLSARPAASTPGRCGSPRTCWPACAATGAPCPRRRTRRPRPRPPPPERAIDGR